MRVITKKRLVATVTWPDRRVEVIDPATPEALKRLTDRHETGWEPYLKLETHVAEHQEVV